jgi:16S rRNA (cytidine1402-2'-O)-methyltransferase
VCRELTKQFESIATMPLAALPGWLAADDQRLRGEFVLVLHARPADVASRGDADASPANEEVRRVLEILLAELPLKQAASLAARITQAPRNAVYARALEMRAARDADG